MARADILNIMYSREMSPLEFKFESLWIPSMYNYLSYQDIESLRLIATSNRYAAKIELKYRAIDEIMQRRGFRKFHCGTNRIVYKYLEDESFLVKIALDKVGMGDNPKEYKNQFLLKPFVTKMFQVSPCGTVAFVERVQPITSRQEFESIGNEVYELLSNCIIGKYVLEDIGTKYFMNYGLRNGFGPVLLDYPYVFELDGNKLYCNKVFPQTGMKCDGEIDYDPGFNNLVCKRCGKMYLAQELEKSIEDKLIFMKDEGELNMKITIKRGDQVILNKDTANEKEYIARPSKTMRAPKRLDVTVNGKKLMEPIKKEEKKFVPNNKTKDEKKKFDKNKDKDFKKGINRYSSNNQNRKGNKPNSRTDKFKTQDVNNEFLESIKAKEEEKKLEKVKEILSNVSEVEKVSEVKESDEKDLYAAFGLTEEDFEESHKTEQEDNNYSEEDSDIMDNY